MEKKLILIITIFITILGIYFYNENTTLEITNYKIADEKIPTEFNNFKIIQISDYHNTKNNKLNNTIIKTIKQTSPDIIVITGDLIDSYRTDIDKSAEFISKIKDIAPIYYVTGNHENKIDNYRVLRENLNTQGVIILNNETKTLKKENASINLIGINDANSKEIARIELKNANYDKDEYNILLSHRPELLDIYAEYQINLALAGHAHGGQISLPFIGGLVAPNQGLFPKYTSGLYKKENTLMIVNRGIGNSIIPFRINNNPELVIITLESK